MTKVLVTGAAGFIGSHTAEKLARDGYRVLGVDNFSPYYDRRLKEMNARAIQSSGAVFMELDLAYDELKGALEGVTHIVHCAAQPGISERFLYNDYFRNNVTATKRLLDAVMDDGALENLVYTSTSSVYGPDAYGDESSEPNPISDYGKTKLEAELLLNKYSSKHSLPISILRLFSVIGPRERPEKLFYKLIESIVNDTDFSLFDGSDEHVRSYTYVGDIVDGIVLTLFEPNKTVGEVFNIGGSEAMTTGQAIQTVSDVIGKPAKIKHLPPRKGDQEFTRANFEKAERVLGYKPKTTFREAIEKQIQWYLNEIHKHK